MTKETKWSIDRDHSEISFKVKHLMIANVFGRFKTFDASIYTTGRDFTTAQVDFWIEAASISTGNDNRDEHLRGADFFNIKKHKQITFSSSTMPKPDKDGNQELWGELTMNGIIKNVMFTVQFGGFVNDHTGNEKAGFSLLGKINRKDWGLVWNTELDSGGFMVSDEITISCEIELVNVSLKGVIMLLEDSPEEIFQ